VWIDAQARGSTEPHRWPAGAVRFTLPADAKAVIFVIRPTAREPSTGPGHDLRQCLSETRGRLEASGLTVREASEPGLLSFHFMVSESQPPLGGFDIEPDFAGIVLYARGKKRASVYRGAEPVSDFLLRVEDYFGIVGLTP
jgi:hypothetical protein